MEFNPAALGGCMSELRAPLSLLASRGDHGLAPWEEGENICACPLWSVVQMAAAGVHCSVVESGGSGKLPCPDPHCQQKDRFESMTVRLVRATCILLRICD